MLKLRWKSSGTDWRQRHGTQCQRFFQAPQQLPYQDRRCQIVRLKALPRLLRFPQNLCSQILLLRSPSTVRLPHLDARAAQWTVHTREKRVRVLEEAFSLDVGPGVEGASSIALRINLNALLPVYQLLSFSISFVWLPRKFPSVLAKISERISLDTVSSNPNYYFQIKYYF